MPTRSQIEHHAEQMEAARFEFRQYFKMELLNGLPAREHPRIEQLCWLFFLHAKGLKK